MTNTLTPHFPEVTKRDDIEQCMERSPIYKAVYAEAEDSDAGDRKDDSIEGMKRFCERDPELFEQLQVLSVDCVHGSTSLNMENILEHGIVPSANLGALGVKAVGREVDSFPERRKETFVVAIDKAEETYRYAELRTTNNPTSIVTLDTYESVIRAAEHLEKMGLDVRSDAIYGPQLRDAEEIAARVASGDIDTETKVFPIVYGIASKDFRPETVITLFNNPVIEHELKVDAAISSDAIKAIFVPQAYVDQLKEILTNKGLQWQVFGLERMREATYNEEIRSKFSALT